MENQVSLIGTLFEKTTHYAKKSAELYKLKAIAKSADVISTLSVRLILIIFGALFFLVFNIGAALWLGELLGKAYFGFFIISGFYAFTGLICYFFRNKWIREPLRDAIITQALN
jgi:hypothetical protein